MKVAVVGHTEWAHFARVKEVPHAGQIIHAKESWSEVAGGGSVAAMQLASLADTCMFFTAVGDDELGRRAVAQLEGTGVEVYASIVSNAPTREAYVYIDDQNERTITVCGDVKPSGNDLSLPWEKLAEADAVYFVSGDNAALVKARKASIVVSTARVLPLLKTANIELDALVASKRDAGEKYSDGDLSPAPKLTIMTDGSNGGATSDGESYDAEHVEDTLFKDSYGCGDSFAAGIACGLGQKLSISEVLNLGAQCGAQAAQRRGAFGN